LPPFDGSHIFFAFLGNKAKEIELFLSRYSFFLLLLYLFFIFPLLRPVVGFIFSLLTGL